MDLQPSTLFDLPFITNLAQILSIVFAGVAVLTAGLVVFCVATECERFRRSIRRQEPNVGSRSTVDVPAIR